MKIPFLVHAATRLATSPFRGAYQACAEDLKRQLHPPGGWPSLGAAFVGGFRDGTRTYFLPLTGALQGIRDELAQLRSRT